MGDASFTPDLEAWEPWRPDAVAAALASMRVPWAVAGGWAIDLHVQAETRPHDDIEIAVCRDHMEDVAACLGELDWFGVGDGRAWPLADAPEEVHQTWGFDRYRHRWRLDVFREPWDGQDWVFRRDPRVRRPLAEVIEFSPETIPYLAPEIVLLFKAKAPTEKDEADLAVTLPMLTRHQIEWLRNALEIVHPKHHWTARLGTILRAKIVAQATSGLAWARARECHPTLGGRASNATTAANGSRPRR